MADAKSRLRDRLMRRYPGVIVDVQFNDHVEDGHGTYKGWFVSFESKDYNLLRGIGGDLAPRPLQCQFGASGGGGNTEFAGVNWGTHGIIDQSERYGVSYHIEEEPRANGTGPCRQRNRALTKKMQTQVMRLLKPFIRGNWKPREVTHG